MRRLIQPGWLLFQAAIVATLLSGQPAHAIDSANDLYGLCSDYERSTTYDGRLVSLKTIPASVCFGYFEGINATLYLKDNNQKPILDICVPNGVNTDQMIKMFLKSAKENPQALHLYSSVISVNVLRVAFPCSNK